MPESRMPESRMKDIRGNLAKIQSRVQGACQRIGRDPQEIVVIAVSKLQPVQKMKLVLSLGLTNFGENYVQEFKKKKIEIPESEIHWHFIGPLQTKKVKNLVGRVDLIHSLDSVALAQEISKHSHASGVHQDCLLQVNIAGESSKNGCEIREVEAILKDVMNLPGLSVCGLMVMPPLTNSSQDSRSHFRATKELSEKLNRGIMKSKPLRFLSMGTSQDFEVAIEEGATHIRVGTTLFGERIHLARE